MQAKIWYLYHSGFAVQTEKHFMIFDYWKQSPKGKGLESGVIDPETLKEQNVIVFASHSHHDHYNRDIRNWGKMIPNLRLVRSDYIEPVRGALMIGPGEKITEKDFTVETLKSNDEGVAFIVDIDGLCIYHAGDLNWWHWEGEPDDENEEMADSYIEQISKMSGRHIDIAFVPVDPRLEDQYAWGINRFMQTVDAKWVIPMHFGSDSSVVDRLLHDEVSAQYREKIIKLIQRGATAEI